MKGQFQNKVLVGGRALVAYGSSRSTSDTDYLVSDPSSTEAFMHDSTNNVDFLNAAGNSFFAEIFALESGNQIASPQSLLELKAYAFVQHCQNFNFQKADDCEFDMRFLVRKFNLEGVNIVNGHVGKGELSEINKVINSTKK